MKSSSVILTSLLAALAVATPLHHHKFVVTEIEWTTLVVTVTAGGAPAPAAPTPEAAPEFTPEAAPPAASPAYTPEPTPEPAAASPTPEASPASSGGSSSAPDSYSQAILDQHNNHRSNHSVSGLVWSSEMASIAAQIASSCVYAHNTAAGGGGYGQNIGAGALPADVPGMITNEMYNNEIGYYPQPYGQSNPDMSNFENWGHFSQIVWANTVSVGCATQYCPGGLANTGGGVQPYFTVCNYSPPGNYGGQYGSNVKAPQGAPSVHI